MKNINFSLLFIGTMMLGITSCDYNLNPPALSAASSHNEEIQQETIIDLIALNTDSPDELWEQFFCQHGALELWQHLKETVQANKNSFNVSLSMPIPTTDANNEAAAAVMHYLAYKGGSLHNLKQLILNENQLSILPAKIGKLSNLQMLVLSRNQLKELPTEIANLSNLQTLYLCHNQLQELPTEIANLSNLRVLELGQNKLKQLPTEIGKLSNLRVLDLGQNKLKQLPTEIANLSSLQTLYLYHNHLQELPTEIGSLHNLKDLKLDKNQLSILPPKIGNLGNLKVLVLNRNQLKELPTEIANLSNLQTLHLYHNHLQELPTEIGSLHNLKDLRLDENQLSILPSKIGNLSNLKMLVLNRNKLKELPVQIGKLNNLERFHFDIRRNHLRMLPASIEKLTDLNILPDNNPWLSRNDLELISTDLLARHAYQQLPHSLRSLCTYYIQNHSDQFTSSELALLPENLGQEEERIKLLREKCQWNIIYFKQICGNEIPLYLTYQLCTPGDVKSMLTEFEPSLNGKKIYIFPPQNKEESKQNVTSKRQKTNKGRQLVKVL